MRNECKIDSASLFMPLDKVTLKNQDDYTNIIMNKGTSEILKETAPSMFFDDRGIKTTIKIETGPYGRANMVKGVYVPIHAKMLGREYFNGINKDNIRTIHQYLNSLSDDLTIPMNSILTARCSDVDFCSDGELLADDDFKIFKRELAKMCQAVGIRHYNPAKATEFYLQTRKTATDTTPFTKIYQKPPEYMGSEHQETFFPIIGTTADKTRAEATMKNQIHLKKFSECGIKSSQFKDVIEGNYSNIVSNVFKHYFSSSAKQISPKMIKEVNELKPLELMFHSQILYELQSMNGTAEANELLITDLIFHRNTASVPSSKTRLLRDRRKLIDSIYKAYFSVDNPKNRIEFNNYMKKIGLMN